MQESFKAICTRADNATVSKAVTLLESLGIGPIVDYSDPTRTRLLVPIHLFNSSLQLLLRAGLVNEIPTMQTSSNIDTIETSRAERSPLAAVGGLSYPE